MRALSVSLLVLAVALGGCAATTTKPAPKPQKMKKVSAKPVESRMRGGFGFDPTRVIFAGRTRVDSAMSPVENPPPMAPDLTEEQIEAVRTHVRTLYEDTREVRYRTMGDKIVLSGRRPRYYESRLISKCYYYFGGCPGQFNTGYVRIQPDDWVKLCFETTEDEYYLLDCQIDNGTWVIGGAWIGSKEVEDGHLLIAFQATGSFTSIVLENKTPNDPQYFYKATLTEL